MTMSVFVRSFVTKYDEMIGFHNNMRCFRLCETLTSFVKIYNIVGYFVIVPVVSFVTKHVQFYWFCDNA